MTSNWLVADLWHSVWSAGAGGSAVGQLGLEVKMKDGAVMKYSYDTDYDRNMWLGIMAPDLVA